MTSTKFIHKKFLVSLFLAGAVNGLFIPEAFTVGQLSGGGHVSGALSVSSTGFAGMTGGGQTGARVTSSRGTEATDMLDFGSLTSGSGETVSGFVTLAVRGNSSYRLNMSVLNYNAQNLAFRGRDVSNAADRGSFVTVRVGTLTGSGSRANTARSSVSGLLQGGASMNQLSQGPVSAESTSLCSGDSPSLGGTSTSPDNAVQVPVYFSVPSGLEFGPAGPNPNANFQVITQIGAFGGR